MSSDLIEVSADVAQNKRTLGELRALSSDLQEKAVKSALRVAAKPLAEAMKRTAPDDPRTAGSRLERAVSITQAKTGARVRTGAGGRSVALESGEFGVIVGPNKKVDGRSQAGLALMLEGGTKVHKISSKNNILRIGRSFIARAIQHPGAQATNWIGGAFDSAASQVENQFYVGLEKWIKRNGR